MKTSGQTSLSGLTSSRRGVLKGAAATATLLASGLWLPRAAQAAPRRGGSVTLVQGKGSTTDSLDPGSWADDYTYCLAYATNNYLTEVDTDGSLKGEIATEWTPNADASEWTFQLRKDVKFHSGATVTGQDVLASFNHHRGEGNQSAGAALMAQVKEITSNGGDSVTFLLEAPNADFPFIVSDQHFPIKPAKDNGIDWQSGIGCGAYVLKNFEPGVSADLERFDGYWKTDRGWFDSIRLLVVLDSSARLNALVTGEAHLMGQTELKMISRIEQMPGISVEETSGPAHYSFPMFTDVAPFDNKDVRLALKFAINREEMLEKIAFGHGALGNDSPIGKSSRFCATEAELPQRSYDPDQAKFHLKQAGLDSLSVQLHAADTAFLGAVDAALLYRESAKAANIDIEVVRASNDGYWTNTWLVQPFTANYWNGRVTDDMMYSTVYLSTAVWNESHFRSETFDQLLMKARSELDENIRREIYVDMQKIINEEAGAVIPIFNNFVWVRSDKLAHDEKVASNLDLDGLRWCERWWLAE